MKTSGKKSFVGFGMGALQCGLFLLEARKSGRFGTLTLCEIDPVAVAACKGGRLTVNVAGENGLETVTVENVQVLHPEADAALAVKAIAGADEIATALPHVLSYERGKPSPADLLARGLDASKPRIVYTAENHPHAAEILRADLLKRRVPPSDTAFVGMAVGRMAAAVRDPKEIADRKLAPLAPGLKLAIVVETFDRIMVAKHPLKGFESGFTSFTPKADLRPYAEVHHYGHIAAHAVLAYEAHRRGLRTMDEIRSRPDMVFLGERLFEECSITLLKRHKGVWDPVFTEAGYRADTQAVLRRITSPYLRYPVQQVIRDPARKLMPTDRLVGPVRMALEGGVEPRLFPLGAGMALEELLKHPETAPEAVRPNLKRGKASRDHFEELLDALWETEGAASPDEQVREALWNGFKSAVG